MTKIVNQNGTIYLGTQYRAGTPIRVFLAGIKNPIYASVRSNGLANIGTRWTGFEVEKVQYEQDIPA